MSDRYTELEECLLPFLQAHWQMVVLAVGAVFLLGGIFNWKWTCDPNGISRLASMRLFIGTLAKRGARINTSILGAIIMLCAVLLWVLGR